MGLLQEGKENGTVITTAQSRKLTIDGRTQAYTVYKIKLSNLFYNDQNDRIATWISKYKADHNGEAPDPSNRNSYNDIIEQFIVESNPDAINKTQNNIELVDQREPGVVLNDGRIIDGNRRFTCLRRLSKKNEKFGYFEAVILSRVLETSTKEIKMLELSIQHGEESKVDYNPIDRLVGVYNDIISTKLISVEEYARSTNEDVKLVNHRVEVAQLMVEFLEFINAPEQFYIARDLGVAATLEELPNLLKKCKTDDEKDDLKNVVFTNILMHPPGEMRGFQRNIKTVIGSDYKDEFLEKQMEIAQKVVDTLPPIGEVSTQKIREVIRNNDPVVQELEASMDQTLTKVRRNQTRNEPIRLAEKASEYLEGIDENILAKMSDSEMDRFVEQLTHIKNTLKKLEENI